MSKQQKYVILGAVGGAALGAASMIMPVYIKPGLHFEAGVTTFVMIGLAVLGGFFGKMTAGS